MSTSVLLVDDHKMMRDGLRAVLAGAPGVDVVGEADDGRTALDLVRELRPELVIMDIGMPNLNGVDATRQVRAENATSKVIVLSTYDDERYVLAAFEAGASAYVLKKAASSELLEAIQAVLRGDNFISPGVAGMVVRDFVARRAATNQSAFTVLTVREREVLQLLAEGNTSPQIAANLHKSVKTVETHRRAIMTKLDLHSIAELTKYAVREGLTDLGP